MRSNKLTKNCIICGTSFQVIPSKAQMIKTCGAPECRKVIKSGQNNPFYGRTHSQETRQKLADKNRREWVTTPCKCGCGALVEVPVHRLKGRTVDGFFLNREHCQAWVKGSNHWNYRGGSHSYGERWPKIAQAVRVRDQVCQMCGKTPEENRRALDVHHKVPWRMTQDNSLENLIALCMLCHRKVTRLEEIEYAPVTEVKRTCIECGATFYSDTFRIQICSDECRRIRQRKLGRIKDKRRSSKKTEYARLWRAKNREHVNAYERQREAQKRAKRKAHADPDQTQ